MNTLPFPALRTCPTADSGTSRKIIKGRAICDYDQPSAICNIPCGDQSEIQARRQMQYRFPILGIVRLLRSFQARVTPALFTGLLAGCLATCTGVGSEEVSDIPANIPPVFSSPNSPDPDLEGVIVSRSLKLSSKDPLLYTGKDRAEALKSASGMDDCVVLHLGGLKNPVKLRKGDVVRVWTTGIMALSLPGQVTVVRIEKIDEE